MAQRESSSSAEALSAEPAAETEPAQPAQSVKYTSPVKEAWLRLRIFYLADVSGEASSRPDKTELLGGHSRSKRSNMIVAIHPAVGAVSCLANV